MNGGELGQYYLALILASNPINRFASFIGDLTKGLVGASRVYEILDLPVETDDGPAAVRLPAIRGAIAYEDVTFAYAPGTAPILVDLNLDIPAGEIVAGSSRPSAPARRRSSTSCRASMRRSAGA